MNLIDASLKISVIITVYNNPLEKLKNCIISIISQSLKPIEIIIVDDGSSKEYSSKVLNLSANYESIIYSKKINGGVASARNHGIKLSQGDFIAFIDPDDTYEVNKLLIQGPLLLGNPDCFAVAGGSVTTITSKVNRSKKLIKIPSEVNGNVYPKILIDFLGIHGTPNYLFRKDCLYGVGCFDERLTMNEDRDLLYRLAKKYTIYTHRDIVCKVNKDSDSESMNLTLKKITSQRIFYQKVIIDNDINDNMIRNYYLRKYILSGALIYSKYELFIKNIRSEIKPDLASYKGKIYSVKDLYSMTLLSFMGSLTFYLYRLKNDKVIKSLQ